jgi:hypothetical protein
LNPIPGPPKLNPKDEAAFAGVAVVAITPNAKVPMNTEARFFMAVLLP